MDQEERVARFGVLCTGPTRRDANGVVIEQDGILFAGGEWVGVELDDPSGCCLVFQGFHPSDDSTLLASSIPQRLLVYQKDTTANRLAGSQATDGGVAQGEEADVRARIAVFQSPDCEDRPTA